MSLTLRPHATIPFRALRREPPRGARPSGTHFLPSVEALEDRCCPSVTIQLNYDYDTHGFFASQARRDVVQLAAEVIARYLEDDLEAITPDASQSWVATFNHPGTPRIQ